MPVMAFARLGCFPSQLNWNTVHCQVHSMISWSAKTLRHCRFVAQPSWCLGVPFHCVWCRPVLQRALMEWANFGGITQIWRNCWMRKRRWWKKKPTATMAIAYRWHAVHNVELIAPIISKMREAHVITTPYIEQLEQEVTLFHAPMQRPSRPWLLLPRAPCPRPQLFLLMAHRSLKQSKRCRSAIWKWNTLSLELGCLRNSCVLMPHSDLMGKTMEALLSKGANLREIQMVLTEEQADQRWGLDWRDCNASSTCEIIFHHPYTLDCSVWWMQLIEPLRRWMPAMIWSLPHRHVFGVPRTRPSSSLLAKAFYICSWFQTAHMGS